MSALTKSERDGLEDVFLSIHTNQDKYKKIKDISSFIISNGGKFSMSKLLQEAKSRLKETNYSHFIPFIDKKKKNLRK